MESEQTQGSYCSNKKQKKASKKYILKTRSQGQVSSFSGQSIISGNKHSLWNPFLFRVELSKAVSEGSRESRNKCFYIQVEFEVFPQLRVDCS